jgi:integrase
VSARKVRERPRRRTLPSGQVRWRAQVNQDGKRKSLGTFDKRLEAQECIDDWYDRGSYVKPHTLGAYAESWVDRHPRGARTNKTNAHRVRRALTVRIAGRELADWNLSELRRKHAHELAGRLLTEQGRSVGGTQNILRTLSAFFEDAITDELAEVNPFRGVRVRSNDPRAKKERREPRVFPLEDLHRLAAAAGAHEAMIRVLSDCGLRLGEMLGLEHRDFDGSHLHVRGNSHQGRFTAGDQPTKRHVRSVPVPPSTAELLGAIPRDLRTPLLFPTVKFCIWGESNWRKHVLKPAQALSGVDAKPQEMRVSYVSYLRARGIDEADLAKMAGHSKTVADGHYVRALNRSDDAVREAIG